MHVIKIASLCASNEDNKFYKWDREIYLREISPRDDGILLNGSRAWTRRSSIGLFIHWIK